MFQPKYSPILNEKNLAQDMHIPKDLGESNIFVRNEVKRIADSLRPGIILTNEIIEILIESLTEFLDEVIVKTVKVTKHRKGLRVEKRDVKYVIERYFNIHQQYEIEDFWY
uniref:Transcription initiation factor TFIID subunit 12 n=1 Tax=Parastrongyloides trichosuri TaxID=131310 RepID=A0A0N4ZTK2_PARTI